MVWLYNLKHSTLTDFKSSLYRTYNVRHAVTQPLKHRSTYSVCALRGGTPPVRKALSMKRM